MFEHMLNFCSLVMHLMHNDYLYLCHCISDLNSLNKQQGTEFLVDANKENLSKYIVHDRLFNLQYSLQKTSISINDQSNIKRLFNFKNQFLMHQFQFSVESS